MPRPTGHALGSLLLHAELVAGRGFQGTGRAARGPGRRSLSRLSRSAPRLARLHDDGDGWRTDGVHALPPPLASRSRSRDLKGIFICCAAASTRPSLLHPSLRCARPVSITTGWQLGIVSYHIALGSFGYCSRLVSTTLGLFTFTSERDLWSCMRVGDNKIDRAWPRADYLIDCFR